MSDDALTHLDDEGRARMVDVSVKEPTLRRAVAEGTVCMLPATLARVRASDLAKGDALAVARLAGIQGAKRTPDLVPLCHPVRLDHVRVDVDPSGEDRVLIRAEVVAFDRTGVEMEAFTAVSAAALALYDMVKGIDRGAVVESIRLVSKDGGRSGPWAREG